MFARTILPVFLLLLATTSFAQIVSDELLHPPIVGRVDGYTVANATAYDSIERLIESIDKDVQASGCNFISNCQINLKLNRPVVRLILKVDSENKLIEASKASELFTYNPANLPEILLLKAQQSGIIPPDYSITWIPSVEIQGKGPSGKNPIKEERTITVPHSQNTRSESTTVFGQGKEPQTQIPISGAGQGVLGSSGDGQSRGNGQGNGNGNGLGGDGTGDALGGLGREIRAGLRDRNLCPDIHNLYRRVVELGDKAKKQGYGKNVDTRSLLRGRNLTCGYNRSQGRWFRDTNFTCSNENECLNSGSTLYRRADEGVWAAISDQQGHPIYRTMGPKERYLNRGNGNVIGDMTLIPLSEGVYIQMFYFNEYDFPFYFGLVIAEE